MNMEYKLTICALFVSTAFAGAAEISIANASFEEPVVSDGQTAVNIMPGWVGGGTYYSVANPADSWFVRTSQGSALPNPISGLNIGGLNIGASIYQELSEVLQPDQTYTLSFIAGRRAGIPFGTPRVSLFAGGNLVAESVIPTPESGRFAPFQLVYSPPTNSPYFGQALRIQLTSAGADSQPWFDDFRLVTGPWVPPPPPVPIGPSVPIENSSFEEPLLVDGQTVINNLPGWVGGGTFYSVLNPRNDWFTGTSEGSPLPSPIDGLNVGGLNVGAFIQQDLTTPLQAGTYYKLRMLVGHRIGVPFGTLTVSLIAGGNVLVESSPQIPLDGRFSEFEMPYLAPSNGPAIGQPIRIRLASTGADAQPWFDRIQLTVVEPPLPTISLQPHPLTVVTGQTASLSIEAYGIPPLRYQWFRDNLPLDGETHQVITRTTATTNDTAQYWATVSNIGGTSTSQVVSLTVILPPPCVPTVPGVRAWWQFEGAGNDAAGGNSVAFSSEPHFQNGVVGRGLALGGNSFLASAVGGPSLDLGQSEGFSIEGWINPSSAGTQALLEWNNRVGAAGLHFYLGQPPPAGNGAGSLFANLLDTQNRSHWISSLGGAVVVGEWQHVALTFSKGSGLARIFVNGSQVASNLFGSFTPQTGTNYHLLFGHRIGGGVQFPYTGGMDEITLYSRSLDPSEIALIHLVGAGGKCNQGFPATIVSNPQNRTAQIGAGVTLSVGAAGSLPLSYQWRYGGAPIDGATNGTLTIENVQLSHAGNYSVVVTNEFGAAESTNSVLVVTRPPAVIRVVNSLGSAASDLAVPVQIVANGTENAAGFSITFNPAVLSFVGADLGETVPVGSSVIFNTNDAAIGRVGMAIGLPSQATLVGGTQTLVSVRFRVAEILNQTTLVIAFGDQPTLRQVSDASANVVASAFVNGTLTISDSQFEGDVAPRPNGDRSLSTIDWVQMGRYVARLGTITSTNEFQRADCAPRSTKGNGLLTASDWVQAGRYAVGLDPHTVLGGPAEELSEPGQGIFAASGTNRRLFLRDAAVGQGHTDAIMVSLNCLGNENAVSFSIQFDPAKLRYGGLGVGGPTAGLTFNFNTNSVGSGRIGVAVATIPGGNLGVGVRELFAVKLVALAPAPATATVSFGNVPVPRDVSDGAANSLATDYAGAIITITEPAGPPLSITRSGDSILVTWTTNSAGFVLEATEGRIGSAWQSVAGVITFGDQKLAIVSAAGKERFFRLKRQ